MTRSGHDECVRAVYDFSAAQYVTTVGTTIANAFERPIDRAILSAFAEDLVENRRARVIDVGCGVGRVTSFLHDRGIDALGIDLSPQMIAAARAAHPHLSFEVAPMTELPADDRSFDAAVLWYSIIHNPLASLPEIWNELHRILEPDGRVLVSFQAGKNEAVTRDHAYGSSVAMTWYRHDTDDVVDSITRAGFVLQTRTWRRPELTHETTDQAFLTLHRT